MFSKQDSLYTFTFNSLLGSGSTIRKRFLVTVMKKSEMAPGSLDAIFKVIPLAASVGGIFVATNARSKELLMPSPKPMLFEIHRTLHG